MVTAQKVALTGLEGSLRVGTYQQLLDISLKSLLSEVLAPQHGESSRADESRPLTQHRGLGLTVSHQGHHAAVHTDCHAVPPAIHEVDLLGEGPKGATEEAQSWP